jgi:3-deoxy-D-manno-octulosonic-acid transferase
MSDRSFPKYQKIAWFYRQIFKYIDEVYAQTQTDKERLELLGAKNVTVTGNIKLSVLPKPAKQLPKPEGMLVCGASTHEGEEMLILNAYLALKEQEGDVKLLLVPRHPERFDKVIQMSENFAKAHKLSMQEYSEHREIVSDITVVDVLGELVTLYAISDLVILGGAFEPIGGHNAAEAAQFGCKIVSGKYYFNQKDIFSAIEGIAIVEASNLSKRVLQHALLKPAKIKIRTDITPMIESIKKVL